MMEQDFLMIWLNLQMMNILIGSITFESMLIYIFPFWYGFELTNILDHMYLDFFLCGNTSIFTPKIALSIRAFEIDMLLSRCPPLFRQLNIQQKLDYCACFHKDVLHVSIATFLLLHGCNALCLYNIT
jgi:hypothetical protein